MCESIALVPEAKRYDEFHLFPKLPTELRLKIWRATFPGRRLVPIKAQTSPGTVDLTSRRNDPASNGFTSCVVIPKALRICKESRIEAERFYQLSFGVGDHPPRIYFDFSTDALYINSSEISFPDFCHFAKHSKDVEKFQTIALNSGLVKVMSSSDIYPQYRRFLDEFLHFRGATQYLVSETHNFSSL